MARDLSAYLVVDIEATCWEQTESEKARGELPRRNESEIIEVGLAVVDTKTKKITEERQFLVKPEKSEVSEFCTKLTGITPEMAAQGVTLAEVSRILRKEYAARERTWISYGHTDEGHFRRECAEKGVPYPFSGNHFNLKLAVEFKYGTPVGLSQAVEREGVAFEGTPHRGIDDARNTALLLIKLLPAQRELL